MTISIKEKIKLFFRSIFNNKLHLGIFIGTVALLLAAVGFLVFYQIPKDNPGVTPSDKWMTYRDQRGFAVQMPKGWGANVTDWGLIKIGPDLQKANQPMVFALTMVYPTETAQATVIKDIQTHFEQSFSGFKIDDQKTADKYSSIIARVSYSGGMTGVLNVNGSGKNYFVSGYAAPSNTLKTDQPDLMKVLASFIYDPTLKDSDKVSGLTKLTSWKDPNEGAFTINVPEGWKIDGGVVRPYIDAALKITATSDNMGIQVENPYPPIYTMPNWALSFAGFTEGSRYNPSGGISQDMIVSAEQNAQGYIQTKLAKQLGLTVDSIKSRDDLVARAPKQSYITQTTAAEATLSGDGKTHKVIVVEQGLSVSGMGIWSVGLTHYWAPSNDFTKVEKIATAMDQSFKLDQTWAQNEQAQAAKRSQIISKNGSDIADIISSTFEYRSSTQDELADKWSDAILGVQDVYDPSTGQDYTVPNTSKYYWTDGLNSVIGTDTHDSPGYYWDWQELTPTK